MFAMSRSPRCRTSTVFDKKTYWFCSVVNTTWRKHNTYATFVLSSTVLSFPRNQKPTPLSSESSKNAKNEHNLGYNVFKKLQHAQFPSTIFHQPKTNQTTNQPTNPQDPPSNARKAPQDPPRTQPNSQKWCTYALRLQQELKNHVNY